MRSLHNVAVSKVFKFDVFAEDEYDAPETGRETLPEEAFLTFSDDDFYFKLVKPPAAKNEKEVAEDDIASAEEEEPEEEYEPEDPAIAIATGIVEEAEQRSEKILAEASEETARMLKEADQKAGELFIKAEEEGRKKGYEQGFSAGSVGGKEQFLLQAEEKYRLFFTAIDESCSNIDKQKREILEQNMTDLSELTLAIAEKIVCIALDSSGEVIKRMILSAAAPAGMKQWAKVTISAKDIDIMREDGIDIFGELYSVSDKIDIIVIDDADRGTCLIEFPDQVIDAGANTQLRNIKDLIRTVDRD